jgi:hypothetical protein
MEWREIIISVAFGAAVILFLVYAARRGEKMVAERAGRTENGVAAKATILAYEEGFFGGQDSKGRFAGVRFNLEVNVAGEPSYPAITFWKVYPMAVPQLQVGKTVSVKVDAADPQIIYPNVPSVEYNWSAATWQAKQDRRGG